MKQRLWDYCVSLVQERLAQLEGQLLDLRAGAESEGKSTAGDKHETGRAMMHLEQEQLQKQIAEFHLQMQMLQSIRHVNDFRSVRNGSLVSTDKGIFYIAIGLGKITFDNQPLFVISASSPLGQAFIGKEPNETVNFGKQSYRILSI